MSHYTEIKKCRICKDNVIEILNLGIQELTGIFPSSIEEKVPASPLILVKCQNSFCGLVQLLNTYEPSTMYGENYGYRSGLNQSMVLHLKEKIEKIKKTITIKSGDLVIDIGANDSTTLQSYGKLEGVDFVGIDPTGVKFHHYYPDYINLIPDFFSAKLVAEHYADRQAKVITSFSMLYDLEDPLSFFREIEAILATDGIWVSEQSYLPFMIKTNSYDTICHEHLEYYCLKQIKYLADQVGLEIIDVDFNNINGGSFSIVMAKKGHSLKVETEKIEQILKDEFVYDLLSTYEEFSRSIMDHKKKLLELLNFLIGSGKKIYGIGASTKGNVLLQYCGLTTREITAIFEVNPDKFGSYTPGTRIPIISEKDEIDIIKPDYLLVLPWHFRETFLHKIKYNLIFPLPKIEVINT